MYNSFLIIFKILLGLECCSEIWFDGCCPGLHQRYPGTLLSGVPDTCWPRGHRSWKLDLGGFSFCRHPQSVQLASMWFQTKTISLKSSNFIWKWYNLVIIIYYNTYIPFSVNKKQKYFLCLMFLLFNFSTRIRLQQSCPTRLLPSGQTRWKQRKWGSKWWKSGGKQTTAFVCAESQRSASTCRRKSSQVSSGRPWHQPY